jgi:hypothetical protein
MQATRTPQAGRRPLTLGIKAGNRHQPSAQPDPTLR